MFGKMGSLFLALALLVPATVHADGNLLIGRVDAGVGRQPGYSVGVITPKLEAWSFANGTDLEIGRLWPVYKSNYSLVLLGGYAAAWSDSQQYFFVPWLTAKVWRKRLRASADVAGYLPVNGGPTVLLLSDAFVGYQATGRVSLGVGSGFFHVADYLKGAPIGPSVKLRLGDQTNVSARYLFGVSGSSSFRLQVNRGF